MTIHPDIQAVLGGERRWCVAVGDCRGVMLSMPDNAVHSIVCDPPYGLSFMGKDWDHAVPGEEYWTEALRVARPGAHLLAFGGTRTFHRMACAIEDAGWEIRDTVMWVYGSGFPKSHNLDGHWCGWGTALKPAWEPVIVARKPLCGTVAANVQEWGTGAINVEDCRVPGNDHASAWDRPVRTNIGANGSGNYITDGTQHTIDISANKPSGRWPANLIHDGSDEVVGLFPANVKGGTWNRTAGARHFNNEGEPTGYQTIGSDASTGSAARFFYCAKASGSDRGEGNSHPTVKPTALMRYLCRLVTPPSGIVLDPFTGSGSTGKAAVSEGFNFIGAEIDDKYAEIARGRIAKAEAEIGVGA